MTADELHSTLLRAFPAEAQSQAWPAIVLIPPSRYPPVGLVRQSNSRVWPALRLGDDTVEIPGRIYNAFPADEFTSLPDAGMVAAGCIYTRHHDGRTRQRALAFVLEGDVPWAAPFIVQLLGEYVVEICVDIERFVRERLQDRPETRAGIQTFVASNPEFMTLTRARAASYWASYYRNEYRRIDSYPALRALDLLGDQAS